MHTHVSLTYAHIHTLTCSHRHTDAYIHILPLSHTYSHPITTRDYSQIQGIHPARTPQREDKAEPGLSTRESRSLSVLPLVLWG